MLRLSVYVFANKYQEAKLSLGNSRLYHLYVKDSITLFGQLGLPCVQGWKVDLK